MRQLFKADGGLFSHERGQPWPPRQTLQSFRYLAEAAGALLIDAMRTDISDNRWTLRPTSKALHIHFIITVNVKDAEEEVSCVCNFLAHQHQKEKHNESSPSFPPNSIHFTPLQMIQVLVWGNFHLFKSFVNFAKSSLIADIVHTASVLSLHTCLLHPTSSSIRYWMILMEVPI